jgi:hypothetical protein
VTSDGDFNSQVKSTWIELAVRSAGAKPLVVPASNIKQERIGSSNTAENVCSSE